MNDSLLAAIHSVKPAMQPKEHSFLPARFLLAGYSGIRAQGAAHSVRNRPVQAARLRMGHVARVSSLVRITFY
jgi:hypothetical protein